MTDEERELDDTSRPRSRREMREAKQAALKARRRKRMANWSFGAVLLLLVGSIPVLGMIGRDLIENSHDGKILNPVVNPSAPGYEALVDPTPTALVVQTGADGKVNGATLLALGNGEAGGGSVVLVPIDTAVRHSASGVDRLRFAHQFGGTATLRGQVGDLLGLGFGEVIEVNDSRWAELVRPLGSITIDNPDAITTASGQEIPAGKVTLTPEQVGPYLATSVDGESDLNRMVRQQLFWQAWIREVSARGNKADLVPGESGTGMSRFIHTMSKGTTDVSVLAVNSSDSDAGPPFTIDQSQVQQQMVLAVPFPIGAFPGQRTRVKVLNGVKAGAPANEITDSLVLGGAEITSLGNASRFGQKQTTIEYYSKAAKGRARFLQAKLGFGKLVYRPLPDQSVEVTVTVGADAEQAALTQPSTTAPTTLDKSLDGDSTFTGNDLSSTTIPETSPDTTADQGGDVSTSTSESSGSNGSSSGSSSSQSGTSGSTSGGSQEDTGG